MPVAERHRNPIVRTARGGRALSAFHLQFFLVRPPRGYGILTTTGRRTGKPRRRCIRVIHDGDVAYAAAIKGERTGWFRNLRANPNVRLRLPGGTFDAVAHEVDEPGERDRAAAAYCGTVTWFDYLAYTLHRSGRPTADKIRDMHRSWVDRGAPVRIELRR